MKLNVIEFRINFILFLLCCSLHFVTDREVSWATEGCGTEIPCLEAGSREGQRRPHPESGDPNRRLHGPHVFLGQREQTGILHGSRKHWLLIVLHFTASVAVSDCRYFICLAFMWFHVCFQRFVRTEVCVICKLGFSGCCVGALEVCIIASVPSESSEISTFRHGSSLDDGSPAAFKQLWICSAVIW